MTFVGGRVGATTFAKTMGVGGLMKTKVLYYGDNLNILRHRATSPMSP